MSNFSSRIFGSAVSALNAQQARIANLSNNIANVNTPGYARRTVNLQTRAAAGTDGLALGGGVEIASVTRNVDAFLEGLLRDSNGSFQRYQTEDNFLDRLESLFSLNGEAVTIGSAMNSFFGAIDDLSVDPSSIELRQNFIERANDLVSSIKNAYDSIASLQTEADDRIKVEVQAVNGLTAQIATLNGQITTKEATGTVAADERDQRDYLLVKLSEKLTFDQVELADGSITVSLPGGFALVNGANSNALETESSPSFTVGGAQMLDSSQPSYVVFNYGTSASPAHIDLSSQLASGTGSLSGLINTRGVFSTSTTNALQVSGPLVDIAARIDALARSLLTQVNTTYLGPDRDGTSAGHQPSSGDLDGNNPSVFGLFSATGVTDADSDGLPETTDLTASGLQTFASILTVTISDPRDVAAARDSGAGAPAAAVYQDGDGRNMEALSALQTTALAQSAGNYSETVTFDENYNQLVAKVANYKTRSEIDARVAEANLTTAQNSRDEVSAVSLDEEFSQLIQFQRAFEASARLIRIADELLQQIVQVV